jgi:hypothetical protein
MPAITLQPRITSVRTLGQFRMELTFSDGSSGEADLSERIAGRGGVFQALEDPSFFDQVQVDPESGTVFWPNGVDYCPDELYSLATGKPLPFGLTGR